MTAEDGRTLPKYARVAAAIQRQVADGALSPGQPAPSGAELSRAFGFSTLTCRRALRALIADGVLVPGPSPNARPRVADPQAVGDERDLADATRALSGGLAARRRAVGLTQAELAARARVSVTTVGHAETGRTWQSRHFWERADTALGASGALLRLHDAYRAAGSPHQEARSQEGSNSDSSERTVVPPRPDAAPRPVAAAPAVPAQAAPSRIMIVWTDGTVTTVHPPAVSSVPPSAVPRPLPAVSDVPPPAVPRDHPSAVANLGERGGQ